MDHDDNCGCQRCEPDCLDCCMPLDSSERRAFRDTDNQRCIVCLVKRADAKAMKAAVEVKVLCDDFMSASRRAAAVDDAGPDADLGLRVASEAA